LGIFVFEQNSFVPQGLFSLALEVLSNPTHPEKAKTLYELPEEGFAGWGDGFVWSLGWPRRSRSNDVLVQNQCRKSNRELRNAVSYRLRIGLRWYDGDRPGVGVSVSVIAGDVGYQS
jgi:hypothetical protein